MFTIYSTPSCPYCVRAKQLLDSKNLTYEEVNVMESLEAAELFAQWKVRTVPQIVHNNVRVGGYEDLVKYLEEQHEG